MRLRSLLSPGRLGAVALLWLLLAGLCALLFWPNVPRSWGGWLLFLLFAPPLYLFAELIGTWIFSRQHGRALSRGEFSLLRIFVAALVLIAAAGAAWWLA
jgi:hypothetical protein